MSEQPAPASPKPLSDDQIFFRDQMYQLLGWGFALILLEGTVILNEQVHFSVVGDPPAGQVQALHPERAAMIIRETKIVIFFIVFLTLGWAWRAITVRCRLPIHPTIPDWHETVVGIVIVAVVQIFIIHEIAGVSWGQIVPAFFASNAAGS
ncbi:MAG: hypothetical protein DVB23_002016 [Verrucomicrobia bacterium]|jgi:hypothetical protein|nr:MAG: hypothetical protein DVB23_002016 [Verrucomicrobiota bacterium]